MALEHVRAFRSGKPQEEGVEIILVPPDSFPLTRTSELVKEHEIITQMLNNEIELDAARRSRNLEERCHMMLTGEPFLSILNSDNQQRTRLLLALIERTFAYDGKLSSRERWEIAHFLGYGQTSSAMVALHEKGIDPEAAYIPILEWVTCYRHNPDATPLIRGAMGWLASKFPERNPPRDIEELVVAVHGQFNDVNYHQVFEVMPLKIPEVMGSGFWRLVSPCEVWTSQANHDLEQLPARERDEWAKLIRHCHGADSARPSKKWLSIGSGLIALVGKRDFADRLTAWLPLVDSARVRPVVSRCWENVDEAQRMHEANARLLRGLLWLAPGVQSVDLTRLIGKVAASAYRKVRGLGPRAVKVGNAAVYALSEIGSEDAIGQLAMLKARVKFAPALKEIEKAFTATAAALNVPVDDVEEMAVPAYGLTEVGRCTEKFGDFTAELSITGTSSTEIAWLKADGKRQQSVPAVVKEKFADDFKELQAAAKDIQRMLPAQRERIDSLFLQQKRWPFAVWRERYLDHPLVGVLARRLLWVFTNGKKHTTGIWFNGQLVDIELKPVKDLDAETTVTLWHLIGRDLDEIVGWRAWLDAQQIQQPFKQAHREVYVLTDAERRTNTYSNRFAAHLLKQHQFNALAALRGWKNKLRLLVDAEFPPASRLLPQWGLRAEFWIEGAGDNYGTDTNETGTFLRVTTDKVRFYPMEAAQHTAHAGGGGYHAGHRQEDGQPMPLEEVPALVFSEIMRDVDLFVGVASVGNDQAWADGGPEGRYRDYWHSYSFGELAATAQTRKGVLQRLVPRLKIAGQCSFADKFLVVKGSLRTYKIHLGSGNILMEPNDQYLCIVPDRGSASAKAGDKVFLPFEGDGTLSIILSKAFLLAEDQKIKDETILRQVKLSNT